MAFDECTPFPSPREAVEASMELSMRWAERSRRAFVERFGHGIFGIVQGGVHPRSARRSAARLVEIGFDGYAIGGLAIGEGQATTFAMVEATVPGLPEDRPRYLMGVGKPDDLVGAVKRGVDMFDCVLPTRSGRTGQAFTRDGALNLKNARHADDPGPLDARAAARLAPGSAAPICTISSRRRNPREHAADNAQSDLLRRSDARRCGRRSIARGPFRRIHDRDNGEAA